MSCCGQQPDQRLRAGHQLVDPFRVFRRARVRRQQAQLLANVVVHRLPGLIDQRPLVGLVAQAPGQVTDDREAQPGRDDQPLDHLAGRLPHVRSETGHGLAPPFQQAGDDRHLIGRTFLGQEHPEDRLLQLRTGFQVGDAVVRQHRRQPGPERLRQAFPLQVQRVQVGVEVLARAVHPLVAGLLLAGRPVAGQLADVRERGQHAERGAQQLRVVDLGLVAHLVVVGEQRPTAGGAHVVAHHQGAHRGQVGKGAAAQIVGRQTGAGLELHRRRGAGRGVVVDPVDPQQRTATVDLRVHPDQDLPDPARVRRPDRGLHLHALENHHGVAGLDVGAGSRADRHHHRRRRRTHHAALVPADPVGDAVHLDQIPGRRRRRDDVVPPVADRQPALELVHPVDLDLDNLAVATDLDPVPARADLCDIQRVGLPQVAQLDLTADGVPGARPATPGGAQERLALQRLLRLVDIDTDVQQRGVGPLGHPRLVASARPGPATRCLRSR